MPTITPESDFLSFPNTNTAVLFTQSLGVKDPPRINWNPQGTETLSFRSDHFAVTGNPVTYIFKRPVSADYPDELVLEFTVHQGDDMRVALTQLGDTLVDTWGSPSEYNLVQDNITGVLTLNFDTGLVAKSGSTFEQTSVGSGLYVTLSYTPTGSGSTTLGLFKSSSDNETNISNVPLYTFPSQVQNNGTILPWGNNSSTISVVANIGSIGSNTIYTVTSSDGFATTEEHSAIISNVYGFGGRAFIDGANGRIYITTFLGNSSIGSIHVSLDKGASFSLVPFPSALSNQSVSIYSIYVFEDYIYVMKEFDEGTTYLPTAYFSNNLGASWSTISLDANAFGGWTFIPGLANQPPNGGTYGEYEELPGYGIGYDPNTRTIILNFQGADSTLQSYGLPITAAFNVGSTSANAISNVLVSPFTADTGQLIYSFPYSNSDEEGQAPIFMNALSGFSDGYVSSLGITFLGIAISGSYSASTPYFTRLDNNGELNSYVSSIANINYISKFTASPTKIFLGRLNLGRLNAYSLIYMVYSADGGASWNQITYDFTGVSTTQPLLQDCKYVNIDTSTYTGTLKFSKLTGGVNAAIAVPYTNNNGFLYPFSDYVYKGQVTFETTSMGFTTDKKSIISNLNGPISLPTEGIEF